MGQFLDAYASQVTAMSLSLSVCHILASQILRVSQISQKRPKETQGGPRETEGRQKRDPREERPMRDPREIQKGPLS